MNNLNVFRKIFMLASCMAIVLATSVQYANAETVRVPITPGSHYGYYGVADSYWYGNDIEHLIPASEIAADAGADGLITHIWIHVCEIIPTSNASVTGSFNIKMMNSNQTTIAARTNVDQMTTVFTDSWTNSNFIARYQTGKEVSFQVGGYNTAFYKFELNPPFQYTGGTLHIRFCNSYSAYPSPYHQYVGRSIGATFGTTTPNR